MIMQAPPAVEWEQVIASFFSEYATLDRWQTYGRKPFPSPRQISNSHVICVRLYGKPSCLSQQVSSAEGSCTDV